MVAAAIGVSAAAGLAGSAISSSASKSAADTQADAANNAAALQEQQWQQTQANLKPYLQLGTSAINPLLTAMGYNVTQNADGSYSFNGTNSSNPLQQTFSYGAFTAPTAAQAQATPGYQFTLGQGLKAVQSSAAARGLGTSGAALKGASTYATGLADSTYNDVFNRALSTYNTNFNTAQGVFNTNYNSAANNVNRLSGIVSNGQNAAATNGSLGAATASNIGNTLTSGANAAAAGTVGSANALTSGLSGVGSNALTYGLLTNNAAGAPAAASTGAYSPNALLGGIGANSYGFTV
ncbi:hypothetical protein GIY62_14795 [Burkholderia plantarii]|uniref:hypothetical protein n=1 Tax=Burkholderia plantarii TaxID=41899 RepID=UPI00272BF894|nr:hypothetical protein [Burkholderia plantarii]WLE58395.1 hypothetical protein GIY62_14795 [Burkholderia plantarii]